MRAPMSRRRLVALGAVELGIAGAVGAIIGTIGGLFLGPALGYLESRILKAARAEETLRHRFARGEIDQEEYEQRHRVLREESPAAHRANADGGSPIRPMQPGQ